MISITNPFRLHSPFFFNDTATTEIYTLSLHDALPICIDKAVAVTWNNFDTWNNFWKDGKADGIGSRSEERFSRNAETDLVCRLLLEKKTKQESSDTSRRGVHPMRLSDVLGHHIILALV